LGWRLGGWRLGGRRLGGRRIAVGRFCRRIGLLRQHRQCQATKQGGKNAQA
jgi:hypothetical protein